MARCLCSRQCSVICSKTARHEQGRSPRGHPQQISIQRHDPKSFRGEWHFSCSWIPPFHASCVQRLEEILQFPAEVQHPRGRAAQRQGAEAAPWEETGWKCCSVSWALNPIPHCRAWLHVYLKEIQQHLFHFLSELIDQPFKSRRRDYRSGYPPRLFQQGAEAGSDMKVYKWNQPFLSALLHLACSVHPGHQPVLLTSTQGAPDQQSWGWEHWDCGLWLCSLSLGWNTFIPCLHL